VSFSPGSPVGILEQDKQKDLLPKPDYVPATVRKFEESSQRSSTDLTSASANSSAIPLPLCASAPLLLL
jgi:hypothetical protein